MTHTVGGIFSHCEGLAPQAWLPPAPPPALTLWLPASLPCKRLEYRKGPIWFALHETLEGFVCVWGLPLSPSPTPPPIPPSFGFIQGLTLSGVDCFMSALPRQARPTSPLAPHPRALLPASPVQGSPANPTQGQAEGAGDSLCCVGQEAEDL